MILTIIRGDHEYIHGHLYQRNADGTPGDAVDITGYTIWFTARKNLTDTEPFLNLNTGNGGAAIITADEGFFAVAIAPYQTASLPSREQVTLFYDLQVKNTINQIFTLSRGKLIVECDVTQKI